MRKLGMVGLLVGAVLLSGTILEAQDKEEGKKKGRRGQGDRRQPNPERLFMRLDADESGGVSFEEFKNLGNRRRQKAKNKDNPRRLERLQRTFERLDKDKDKSLSKAEFAEFRPPRRAGRGRDRFQQGDGKGRPGRLDRSKLKKGARKKIQDERRKARKAKKKSDSKED